ncbi:unnamed protein product, partial [Discosporangium mesarthrocarpum]
DSSGAIQRPGHQLFVTLTCFCCAIPPIKQKSIPNPNPKGRFAVNFWSFLSGLLGLPAVAAAAATAAVYNIRVGYCPSKQGDSARRQETRIIAECRPGGMVMHRLTWVCAFLQCHRHTPLTRQAPTFSHVLGACEPRRGCASVCG